MAIELAVLERAHRIADIVADAVGRIDQRVVPVGVEQRGERVRLVMIGEMDLRVGAERVVAQEALGVENVRRVGGAETAREDRKVAIVAPAARALHGVAQFAPERHAQMIGRMEAARHGDRVDIVARPAGDAQHLVDSEPRHRLAVALDRASAAPRRPPRPDCSRRTPPSRRRGCRHGSPGCASAACPGRRRVARPHDAEIEHARVRRARRRGVLLEHGLEPGVRDHASEGVGR